MASAKGAAKNFFHDKFHHHSSSLPRSSKSSDKATKPADDAEYQRHKEEDKHNIAQHASQSSNPPLSPNQVAKDPSEKNVGKSSKYLRRDDFQLVKTIGTGTFARVWLAKLAKPQQGDEDKVFALKILRKVDSQFCHDFWKTQ